MKKAMVWLLIIGLMLVFAAVGAAAAPGDIAFFQPEAENDQYWEFYAAVAGDAVYAYKGQDGIYRYRMGDAEPSRLVDLSEKQFNDIVQPEGADETNMSYYYINRIVGGDKLHLVVDRSGDEQMSLELWTYSEEKEALEKLADIEGEKLIGGDGYMPYFESFVYSDGALYSLVNDWMTNTSKLYQIDTATGAVEIIPCDNVTRISGYTQGKLLVGYGGYEDMGGIGLLDIATGQIEEKLVITADNGLYQYEDMTYDAETDTVYLRYSGELKRSIAFGPVETVAYMPMSIDYDTNTGVLPGGYYVIASRGSGLVIRNVDPQYKPSAALKISGLEYEETVRKFSRDNPGFPLTASSNFNTWELDKLAMRISEDDAPDVFTVGMDSFKILYERGYLNDLSDATALTGAVQTMYPNIQEIVTRDGALMGIPYYIDGNTFGYIPKSFTDIGLTVENVPTTYIEMIDLIDRWHNEFSHAYPDMKLFPAGEDMRLRETLLTAILNSQVVLCQHSGEPITFDTPAMREVLARIDKIDYSSYKKSDSYGWGSDDKPLFADYVSVTPSKWREYFHENGPRLPEGLVTPMPIKLAADAPSLIPMFMNIIVVNPHTKNRDMALEFIQYYVENLPATMRIAMMPNVSEPIEDDDYLNQMKYINERRAQLEAALEEADEGEKANLENELKALETDVERAENMRWAYSAKDIENYRAQYENAVYADGYSLFGGAAGGELQTLITRYSDGQIASDQFIAEISQKLRMIEMEG